MATPLNEEELTRLMAVWKTYRILLLVMATKKCFGNKADGDDMLQNAFLRLLEGEQRWNPDEVPFVTHVRRVMQGIKSKARKKAEVHRIVPMLEHEKAGNIAGKQLNPEQVLMDEEGTVLSDDMFDEVCAELPKDSTSLACMGLALRDILDPQAQADELGVHIDRVYEARKRIKEKIDVVLSRHGLVRPQ
jgi:DNA-directed RNA polymerase specialized sigma24 family protein